MDKEGRIGIRRRPSKPRRNRGFAKALADYLKSNCYMYAPLLDWPPSATTPCSPSDAGVSTNRPVLCKTHRSVSFRTETVSVPSDKGESAVQLQKLISK